MRCVSQGARVGGCAHARAHDTSRRRCHLPYVMPTAPTITMPMAVGEGQCGGGRGGGEALATTRARVPKRSVRRVARTENEEEEAPKEVTAFARIRRQHAVLCIRVRRRTATAPSVGRGRTRGCARNGRCSTTHYASRSSNHWVRNNRDRRVSRLARGGAAGPEERTHDGSNSKRL